VLLAIWDGEPSRGAGGTAETLLYSLERSIPVLCILTDGRFAEYTGSGEVDAVFNATGFVQDLL
jgi:hypothetical protein